MEIKEIEAVLDRALKNPEDESLRSDYADLMAKYLKNHKSSDELVTIVVRGIDIDRASNYFDYVESVSRNEIQSIWKQVRENREVSGNKNNNGLKLVSGLLGLAFMKVGNMEMLSGNIIAKLISMITDEKNSAPEAAYGPVILDYFVEDVLPGAAYPGWETFRLSGAANKSFAEMILRITSGEKEEKYKNIRQWAVNGIKLAEKQTEREKIEARIPRSRISDLQAIAEHYRAVEKQVREDTYEMVRLRGVIRGLQDEIGRINAEKRELEGRIAGLTMDVDAQKRKVEEKEKAIEEREKEIKERKKINDAADALKKNDEEGLLRDIANSLRTEYRDFAESEKDEMDIQLGEIYREKLRNIFKLLANKGIRME